MKDYIIITPKEWGPLFWNFLHSIPDSLTKDNICYFNAMFKKLAYVIPCNICKEHYDRFYDKNKLEFTECPRYIRVMDNAISIEIKRLE